MTASRAMLFGCTLTRLVKKRFPKLDGALLSDLNKHEMELSIEKNPVVKKCEIFATH